MGRENGLKRGVLRAAHTRTTFQCEYPPGNNYRRLISKISADGEVKSIIKSLYLSANKSKLYLQQKKIFNDFASLCINLENMELLKILPKEIVAK